MPRTGGNYTLPSPPSPYVPNTTAKAEDINSTFTDIASALTGSVPVDGSAVMTGPLTLSTSSPTAALQAASKGYVDTQLSGYLPLGGGTVTSNLIVNGSLNTSGPIQSGGGRIISAAAANPSITVWNTTGGGEASSLWIDTSGTLYFGDSDGSGNPTVPRMTLDRTTGLNVVQNVSASDCIVSDRVRPAADNTAPCGDASHQWSAVYAYNGNFAGYVAVTDRVRPVSDNTGLLGDATHRWTQVWATNGTIQTSDPSEKRDMRPLPDGCAALVQAIDPVRFRWKHDQQDSGVHWGFNADRVKQAMDARTLDFAGIVKDGAAPAGLRADELLAVLWKAVQELAAIVQPSLIDVSAR